MFLSRPHLAAAAPTAPRRAAPLVPRALRTDSIPTNPFVTGMPNATVYNVDDQPVKLADLTAGKTVLALLRHWGCPLCWSHLQNLQLMIPKIEAAGYRLVVLGVGQGSSALKVCEKTGFPSDKIYGDVDREAYRALSLVYGLASTFVSPSTGAALLQRGGLDGLREAAGKYVPITPNRPEDVFQQGGLLVLDGPLVEYAWADQGTGDHAPLEEWVGVCCGDV